MKSNLGLLMNTNVFTKNHVILFCNLINVKKNNFCHKFIFVFVSNFIGVILSKKYFQKWGVGEKDMKGQWPYREGVVYRRGFKPSAHYGWKLSKHSKPGKNRKSHGNEGINIKLPSNVFYKLSVKQSYIFGTKYSRLN